MRGKVKELSPELREALKDCPYVVRMTNCKICWSKKLYEEFCHEYDKGAFADQILRDHGIDPKILGPGRIAAFRAYYERHYRTASSMSRERTPEAAAERSSDKLSKVEHEVEYLRQEVEFLKKILILENPELGLPNLQKNTK